MSSFSRKCALKTNPNTDMKFEWFIASRYLKSRREQSFISIIGVISVVSVALGIAVVILVISVMNGFEHGLKEKFLANEAHVTVRSAGGNYFSNYQDTIRQSKLLMGSKPPLPSFTLRLRLGPHMRTRLGGLSSLKALIRRKKIG